MALYRGRMQLPTLACLWPPGEEFEAGSITSVFSNRAVVKYSRLEDVLHGCSWKVNNKLDGTYLPLPVDKIIQRTKKMVNRIVQYSLIEGNCEHFVNDLRYGVPRSQQVWYSTPGRPCSSAPGSVGPGVRGLPSHEHLPVERRHQGARG